MLNYLKIKCVSLAAESKLIRKDENKRIRFAARARRSISNVNHAEYHDSVRSGLHHHRTTIVRTEARAANLAYAFCRGFRYSDVERKAFDEPNWSKIKGLVISYGVGKEMCVDRAEMDTWITEGKEYWNHQRAQINVHAEGSVS